VRVTEVFHVFGEVAEEEDVILTDFAGYFDLDFVSGIRTRKLEYLHWRRRKSR